MNEASASFERMNEQASQRPIYTLEIPSLSAYISSGRVDGLETARQLLSKAPAFPRYQVELLEGRTSQGSASLELVDGAGYFASLMSQTLTQRIAVLKQGFRRLPFDSFFTRYTGKIGSIDVSPGGMDYKLTIQPKAQKINSMVLDPAFYSAEECPTPGASLTWVSTYPTTSTTATLTLTDSNNDSIFDKVTLTGSAFHIALCMLFSGGSASGSEAAYFNVWPAWAGAGLADDEVNIDKWLEALDNFHWAEYTYVSTQAEKLKDLLELEFMKVFNGYIPPTGDGAIGCYIPTIPSQTSAVASFTDRDIFQGPNVYEDDSLLITSVEFRYDWDGSRFLRKIGPLPSERALSGRYTDLKPHVIESKGLTSEGNGLLVARIVSESILKRFGVAPRRVVFSAFARKGLADAGDHASIQSKQFPNIDTPKPLSNRKYKIDTPRYIEITSIQPGSEVQVEAIDLTASMLNDGLHPCIITEDGAPVYADATATEKAEDGFLCDVATGLMPDSTQPYSFV